MSPNSGTVVLVVDDEEQVRKLTCRILQRAGYVVLSARNGPEALRLSRAEGTIHLLLSDVEMDGMGGIELCKQIKVERPGVAVLIYSANLAHATDAEFPFLGKPFVPKDLLSAVKDALAEQPAPVEAPAPDSEPAPVPRPEAVDRRPPLRWRALSVPFRVAAAVAICLIPFSIYEVFRPSEVLEPVYLRAVRGLPASLGSVGRPLMLNLDLSALPRHESLGVELVDKDGHLIWRRSIRVRAADALPVKSPALPSGLYYVRAYSPSKALLREYELRIGRNQ